MNVSRRTVALSVAFALGLAAEAAAAKELAGATMPDTLTVAGKTLKLNGMGLRKKAIFKVYVGGLYLEAPSKDAAAILAAGLLNTALFSLDDAPGRMDAIVRGWDAGRRAKLLFGYDWAASFPKPIEVARAEVGLPPEGIGKAPEPATVDAPAAGRREAVMASPDIAPPCA